MLEEYLARVLALRDTLNVTSITEADEARIIHLEDSLSALPEVQASPPGPLVDLGTGGGFPGVPLAVASKRETTLVDGRAKKIHAVMNIVNDLQIRNVDSYAGRVEELALERPGAFAVATARALTALPSLLELAAPLLSKSGRLIAYESAVDEEELAHVLSLEDKLAMKMVSRRSFSIGDGAFQRTLLVFEKTGEPQVKLPRRPGMAQKRPYKA